MNELINQSIIGHILFLHILNNISYFLKSFLSKKSSFNDVAQILWMNFINKISFSETQRITV